MSHALTPNPVAPPITMPSPLVFIGASSTELIAVLDRGPGAHVVVFAPDPEAARQLRAATPAIDADRVSMLVGPDYSGAAQVATRCAGLAAARIVVDPVLGLTRPDDVVRAQSALARLAFQSGANDGARRASAGRYLLHTLANAPRISREANVAVLADLFAGIPAVIVAAGPSLDRNIAELAAVKDQVLIVACDTAARPLMSVGIDPHIIVAADSSRANAAHLTGLPPSKAWPVAEGSLHPSAFVHFDQRTFIFRVADHHPWAWLRSLGIDAARVDTWGSVATSAFSLAQMLGCGPVALIGADFAFTDGRPYCRGTSFEAQWACWHAAGSSYDDIWRLLRDRWASVTTERGIDGSLVETAPHLLSFRDWLSERARAAPHLRVINATGAGLLTGPSIEQRPLASAIGAADAIDRRLVDRVLSAAHECGRGDVGRLLSGVSALAIGDEQTITTWMEFGAGSVSVASLTAALRSPEYAAWSLVHQRRA
jgi:hypothetical protein